MSKFFTKVRSYFRELGKLTPLAIVTTFLPFSGSAVLLTFSSPISNWFRDSGEIGWITFLCGVIFFCGMSLLPTNVIGTISGWAFGFPIGITLLMSGIAGAATLSYLLNRRVVGKKLEEVLEHHPKAKVIYAALLMQSRWRTMFLIFLLRLSPAMPFALTNFLMTSARVPFSSFIFGTFFGMLPRSVAVVLMGSRLAELTFDDTGDYWILVFGIAVTVATIIFIGRIGKRALVRFTETQAEIA